MKWIIPIVFVTILCGSEKLSAQNNSEFGLRLGYAVALDYVMPINDNRFRSNLGWGIDYLLWDNFYEFCYPIAETKWNIYAGIGPGLRYWLPRRTEFEGWGLAAVGQVGTEVKLQSKFTIGIDWSPFYDVIKNHFNNYGTVSMRKRF